MPDGGTLRVRAELDPEELTRDTLVGLMWIGEGEGDPSVLRGVAGHIERVFELPVRLLHERARPTTARDRQRSQDSSGQILEWLAPKAPPAASRIVAVTDADLFIPVLTFVFGEAQIGGRAAVVSTARLGAVGDTSSERLIVRLSKEVVHQLGHTLALVHCKGPCVMSRAFKVDQIDARSPDLCSDCRARLRETPQGIADDGTQT